MRASGGEEALDTPGPLNGTSNTGISCLDSYLGRVPAYDACNPGSIPGGGNINVCLQVQGHNQHYTSVPPPPPPPPHHRCIMLNHTTY
jgi:hypothetical protein